MKNFPTEINDLLKTKVETKCSFNNRIGFVPTINLSFRADRPIITRLPDDYVSEFTDWTDEEGFAVYDQFMVGSAEQKYQLTLGRFVDGNRGDALSYHNNSYFTTYVRMCVLPGIHNTVRHQEVARGNFPTSSFSSSVYHIKSPFPL